MCVYKKFIRSFLVLIVGVFFLVGCTEKKDDKTTTPPEPITVLDSTNETISQNEIKTLLENNETTYTKSFTLDDKKTKVKLSFDLLENNVTKDIKLDVESFDYKEDGLTASILKLSSSVPLKNVDIEVEDTSNNKTLSKINKKINVNKITPASIGEAPTFITTKTNILTLIKSTKLEQVDSKNYTFTIETTQYFKNVYCILNDKIFKDSKSSVFGKNKKYVFTLPNLDSIYTLSFGIKDDRYTDIVSLTSGTNLGNFVNLQAYKMTSDFIGLDKSYTVAEKTLDKTRSLFYDISRLNDFTDTAEHQNKVKIVDETVTHRITDFDKLLNVKSEFFPPLWKSSNYGKNPQNDNERMPLILVHGWNGEPHFRDPTKLLLWENSEYEYWHKFISFYLTSQKLQKKYHLYLYRYPSYKHVAYNAKIFKELLDDVSAKTDLGQGLSFDGDGITIMAHSMGGMVARAMIEDFKGLGDNAKKLKKLITLDTPHRGSVGSMDNLLTNTPKDLNTHGAMDLNYDNIDRKFSASELKKFYNNRRTTNGVDNFDKVYCNQLKVTHKTCMDSTANPYMKFLNDSLVNNNYHSEKYIFYTAWTVTGLEKLVSPLYGTSLQNIQNEVLDLSFNNIPDLNYLNNKLMGISTAFMGKYGYSAGGAETVGSSIFSSNKYPSFFNPKYNEAPSLSTPSTNDLYHKDLLLNNICMNTVKNLSNKSICIDKRNLNLALIINSIGNDHPYKIPYRLFWDYDHDTIFQGADSLGSRDSWDGYINQNGNGNTNKDTQFYSHRIDYVQGAMKIRYGEEVKNISSDYVDSLNPLKYEPVFLVLEKDLLTSVTNGDIDEDKLPDEWEEANGLRWVNADDANEDSDNDGLTNLQEYNNNKNSTDPQNEDSDGDGFKDGEEVTAGTNPNDKSDYPNTPPTANAGADQSIKQGETVTLDASGSSDAEDDIDSLSFVWKEGDKELGTDKIITLNDLSVGTHTITLTVSDSSGASSKDEVVVIVIVTKKARFHLKNISPISDSSLYPDERITLIFDEDLAINTEQRDFGWISDNITNSIYLKNIDTNEITKLYSGDWFFGSKNCRASSNSMIRETCDTDLSILKISPKVDNNKYELIIENTLESKSGKSLSEKKIYKINVLHPNKFQVDMVKTQRNSLSSIDYNFKMFNKYDTTKITYRAITSSGLERTGSLDIGSASHGGPTAFGFGSCETYVHVSPNGGTYRDGIVNFNNLEVTIGNTRDRDIEESVSIEFCSGDGECKMFHRSVLLDGISPDDISYEVCE